jgi:hypothetical protein
MRGLRLIFDDAGPRFDTDHYVQDLDATVQNALVNVGTDMGSDPWFTGRGTNLKKDGAAGRMATTTWANHAANFAALRTLAFSQATEADNNAFKLQDFTLRCESIKLATAVLNVLAVSVGGQVVGGLATI